MTDTGPPLNLPQLPRGTTLWDDDVNTALGTINTEVATLIAALQAKADLVSGKVPTGQLPTSASAISVTPVANQAARLALSSATVGTAALQITDPINGNNTIYVLTATPPSTNGNWTPANPGLGVSSYNAQTGALTGKPEYSTTGTWALKQTFTVSPSVPTASASDAPVPKAQLDSAIAGVSASSIPGRYTTTLGNGTLTTFGPLTHGRGTASVLVQAWDVSVSPRRAMTFENLTSTSTQVTVTFANAPALNQVELVII